MTLTVGSIELDQIRRHGESDYPHECCGLLIGSFEPSGRKLALEIFPISNAREETAKRNRFLIAPEDLMRGERHARQRERDVVGFYHSHPDHPAVPSAFDLEHAWPVYSYVIVSVRNGRAEDLLSYELRSDRSRFDAEDLLKGP
jgi:proteasome lid subunit RPN8/RPN11